MSEGLNLILSTLDDCYFIVKFKRLACLFSLNMSEQCLKVWH